MKTILVSTLLSLICLGCSSHNSTGTENEVLPVKKMAEKKEYPKNIKAVFDAHGGIKAWEAMETLSYEFESKGKVEKQTIDLKSRKVKIEQDKFNIGFDGNEVWVEALDTNTYKGDARFYHNLYFYFYAMPFVLGDDGITYSEAESLVVDSMEYPGIKISYKSNVGDSPDDNYFLYYNKETKQAEWLGYTVTYFNGKPSTEIHYLKFSGWENINGLKLPKNLTWYNLDLENNTKKERGSMTFSEVKLSKTKANAELFVNPN